jgi:signal transduction histidine kinase
MSVTGSRDDDRYRTPKDGSLEIGKQTIAEDPDDPFENLEGLEAAPSPTDEERIEETERLTESLVSANEQLEEAVQTRDMFISVASHELRTPLGAMQLLVELLRREASSAEEGRVSSERILERLEGIDRQVGRMSKLVDRLLDVSRLSEGRVSLEMGPVNLVDIVEQVVDRQRDETEEAELSVVIESDGAVVGRWDPDRIDQVVTNLVSNAVKYGEGEPIEVGVADRGDEAACWVTDRGEGIPPAQRERIFERFERGESDHNHSGGLGLGLWIVREIVHAFGGDIDVESEVGKGSTFYVTLPKE